MLVDREPDLVSEQIAVMAKAQATVFGVPDSEVDELVSGMLAELFPAELEESDGSARSGGGVDLGSGDGRVLSVVASRTGCSGVGIEASARLVQRARVIAGECGVGDRVVFFHELIGWRGLGGATVVYAWLLPGVSGLLAGLAREALALGGLRAVVLVGEAGEVGELGPVEVIGEVPVEGRIRVAGGVINDNYFCRLLQR